MARPLSVLVSSIVQPMPWRELTFISWAGLRGAVPIVLTTIPLAEGVDDADRLFDIVFVMVVVYTLLTGPTLPLVARLLRVARRSEPRGLEVEAAPLERVAADLLQVTIAPSSRMHGVEVGELRLPPGASVSLVIRQGQALVPERRTVLRHGDDLLVVTPRKAREATEERLRQVSSGGRLAQWLGDPKHAAATSGATGSRAGCRRWRLSTAVTDSTSFLRSALKDSPTTTTMPRPSSSPETILADLNWRATRRTAALRGSSLQIWTPLILAGALPLSAPTKPRSSSCSMVAPARPLRSLPL